MNLRLFTLLSIAFIGLTSAFEFVVEPQTSWCFRETFEPAAVVTGQWIVTGGGNFDIQTRIRDGSATIYEQMGQQGNINFTAGAGTYEFCFDNRPTNSPSPKRISLLLKSAVPFDAASTADLDPVAVQLDAINSVLTDISDQQRLMRSRDRVYAEKANEASKLAKNMTIRLLVAFAIVATAQMIYVHHLFFRKRTAA